ncbi:galactokinase family protein [Robertkochia solimangrovi]|uniref:GHMP family kinase ATP-binding protein n=1 Tax=Robertkochia solimangrovi TaxID=2213046 RepID=UPI0013A5AA91|nr:galactokinase family protein [Robertkochia solimangrovi]
MNEIEIIAPGRICLFGDHQDYLGLPVIACAIDRTIHLKAIPNTLSHFRINMPDIDQRFVINVDANDLGGSDKFFVAALRVLRRHGFIPANSYDLEVYGNIPINAGLSSSSALVVAWVAFLLKACGSEIDKQQVARLSYEAEVLEFSGPGGLMDMYSISLGEVIFLDTVSGSHEVLKSSLGTFVIGVSGVAKETLAVLAAKGTLTKKAISQIQRAVPAFDLKESTVEDFDRYQELVDEDLLPLFEAAIKNYDITRKAHKLLKEEVLDLEILGALMYDHHRLLSENIGVSVPLVDAMVTAAMKSGAFGGKIVGSGGGGCMVAWCAPDKSEEVIRAIMDTGAADAFVVEVAKGIELGF